MANLFLLFTLHRTSLAFILFTYLIPYTRKQHVTDPIEREGKIESSTFGPWSHIWAGDVYAKSTYSSAVSLQKILASHVHSACEVLGGRRRHAKIASFAVLIQQDHLDQCPVDCYML